VNKKDKCLTSALLFVKGKAEESKEKEAQY
jgi:hypothetical protein